MHSNHTDEGGPTASAPERDDVEAARELLAKDLQERMEACNAEIHEVLDKYGMKLDITKPEIVLLPMS